MGRRNQKHHHTKSHTLPSSPTHSFSSSSSSSDFEFTISISPRKSSATADELFYKGQLLPLHLSPRLSMVRTLLLSDSSSDTTSRDSTASSSSLSSSRPSSALAPNDDENEFKRLTNVASTNDLLSSLDFQPIKKSSKYFSLAKLSAVFRSKADNRTSPCPQTTTTATVKRVSASAKEVIRKYLKKVKPLYEKLSSSQKQAPPKSSRSANTTTICMVKGKDQEFSANYNPNKESASISHSFSGNLRYPRRKRGSMISSCPSSMMSSPSHCKSGFGYAHTGRAGSGICSSDASSLEELQSAIQGAIAHCKNSMLQNNKAVVSNEI